MQNVIKKIFGFPIKIDWTFYWMFVVYILVYRNDYAKMNYNIAILASIYLCVLLHEFGHVYVAKWLGYPCEQVKMYMLGGIAQITGEWDKKPKHELLIGIAGPMVNVVIIIAITSFYFFDISLLEKILLAKEDSWIKFFPELAFGNLVLIIFNMLPIFPLDGGRIFRAIVSLILKNHKKATLFVNYVALFLSIILAIFMTYASQYITVFIAVLIFIVNLFEIISTHKKDKDEKIKEQKHIERMNNSPKDVTVLFRKEDMKYFGTYKGAYKGADEIPDEEDPLHELSVFGKDFRRPFTLANDRAHRFTQLEITEFFTSFGYFEKESCEKNDFITYIFSK